MLLNVNILFRVVRIYVGETVGTGTLIEHLGSQYLLTAAHVVSAAYSGQRLDIEARWGRGSVTITKKETRSDTAILKLNKEFSLSKFSCALGGDGYSYSQDVFLLGFPAGQGRYVEFDFGAGRQPHLNPFARKGIISNMGRDELIVDCLVQKGFSGGPVVICQGAGVDPTIIGIISGGILFDSDRHLLNDDLGVTIRSGFTSCQTINIATEIIEDLF